MGPSRAHVHRMAKKLFKKMRFTPRTSVSALRAGYDDFFYMPYVPNGVDVSCEVLANIETDVLSPRFLMVGHAVLYAHGGFFISGSPMASRALCASLADEVGAKFYIPAYQLAPEHPFPAALENMYDAYVALIDQKKFRPEDIIFSGDGAGAGLMLALTHYLKQKGLVCPRALALISPWVDLTEDRFAGEGVKKKELLLTRDMFRYCALQYTYADNFRNSLVSPLFGNFGDFPPVFVQCGEQELFHTDACALAQILEGAGVQVTLDVWPGMWHLFQSMESVSPCAHIAVARMGAWAHRMLESPAIAVQSLELR
ncbi:alpha/beta hydrolase [Treponema pallidum]|uniref:N-acetylphosphinothricin-tripetide-deacetylase, putative n=4 Tax=Treponema pallidum TaxID=160 RepID=O83905_TREPA|nr:alpha/beta hydrolase [Treponema pallidum]AAC65892.1 N-acetylphosphinothricin-tripetide-deacetylase, putative [Treponema pallidum subsp. pallidum str. Nichols]ACD71351.1 possible N-acetylphosphinothricin-tripetide-deacetylase [Treponema pallidum subsp. pallidum SS14]AFU66910.1 hypothetical protein TPAMA_0935 [Treponema pallidum subsp. pallidum str. Mexico A]AWG41806.1 hypothetical protein TPELMNP1_0935 [Treponema pallidum subsp. pertenue]QBC41986.1 alpha/beta hydrolase fold domain protein [T